MQYQHIGDGIKGFYRVGADALKSAMNNDLATQRLRTLEFWDRHGLEAALAHSGKRPIKYYSAYHPLLHFRVESTDPYKQLTL